MTVAHPWHKLTGVRPLTVATPNVAVDHRFSDEELADLLSALRARAESHPDNPGLVACWPAVPEQRMAAACRLLAGRGHPVQRVPVTAWDRAKTRDGWTLVAPVQDLPPAPDIVSLADTERWTNEGGGPDRAAMRR
jgi:hypothetical protein